jgi:DNA-binding MarR family transcriptional regulator
MPISTLLSQALVAFTIELDNEFERRMPHRTSNHGSTDGSRDHPWLVSMAMWSNCMRFVGDEGVSVKDLERLARTTTNLKGMERWGYIVLEAGVIRPTPKGRQAREVWAPLFGIIEKRWQERFGKEKIDQLRESLTALIRQFDFDLPDCLPILEYGLFSRVPEAPKTGITPDHTLPALLSKVLLAFAVEFENESDLSLAISANVLRILTEEGVRVRDLPRLSGVSKEAISMAMGVLKKRRIAVVEADLAGSRAKIARLTSRGQAAQDAGHKLLAVIEERWRSRFGTENIDNLREGLDLPHLFEALEPYPDGWRAAVRRPTVLPHYPMVLHRGGFPDGS